MLNESPFLYLEARKAETPIITGAFFFPKAFPFPDNNNHELEICLLPSLALCPHVVRESENAPALSRYVHC